MVVMGASNYTFAEATRQTPISPLQILLASQTCRVNITLSRYGGIENPAGSYGKEVMRELLQGQLYQNERKEEAMRKQQKKVFSILVALFFVAGAAFAAPTVVKPTDLYAGMTYGDWSAAWWQYAIQTPYEKIFTDDTSATFDCASGQSSAPVFFLVGGGSEYITALRTCTVPRGKAILFPIINAECSTLEPLPWRGENEYALRTCASSFGNATITDSLKVTVDGAPLQNLKNTRVQSPVFTFKSPDANSILGMAGTGLSASDGYWVLLNPLSPGKHKIHFEGAGEASNINGQPYINFQNVTYELTVQ